MDNNLPKRKNTRLKYHDYSSPRAYFITICTHEKQLLLSRIVGAIHESPAVELTEYGEITAKYINEIPNRFNVKIKRYVIMPNHIHIVFLLNDSDALRAIRESPLQKRSMVSKIVGYLKMNVSKEIHSKYMTDKIWQRGFYDHIIRDFEEYKLIEKYIYENPKNWQFDKLYRK